MLTSGAITGGISSVIAGGQFWSGVKQGIITIGLNHLLHELKEEVVENIIHRSLRKAGLDPKGQSGITNAQQIKEFLEKVFPHLSKLAFNPSYVIVTFDEPERGGESPRRYKYISNPKNDDELSYFRPTVEQDDILISESVIGNNFDLAKNGSHELMHRVHLTTGVFTNWVYKYGSLKAAETLSEIDAYEFTGEDPLYNKTYQYHIDLAKLKGWER